MTQAVGKPMIYQSDNFGIVDTVNFAPKPVDNFVEKKLLPTTKGL